MTGLETDRHVLLEIAVVVTDSYGEIIDDGIDIIINQPEEVFAEMDDYVTNMHESSGLLEQVKNSSISLSEAEQQVMVYLNKFFSKEELKKVPVSGNSIGVDRRFLNAYMKNLDESMHYRSIDVSTLKEIFRRIRYDDFKKRPSKKTAHRALDDILESIEEYKYYLQFIN